jgi:formyl-CoA transferase
MTQAALTAKLDRAQIAFARVNDPALLARHPHLRRIMVDTPSGTIAYPAPPARSGDIKRHFGRVPAVGEHSEKIRAEFRGAKA